MRSVGFTSRVTSSCSDSREEFHTAPVRRRMLFIQHGLPEQVEFLRCLIETHSWPQAAHRVQVMPPRPSLRHAVLHRRPQLGGRPEHILEIARHDPDDQIAAAVECDLSADDGGITTETPLPERVAEDDDVWAVQFDRPRPRRVGPELATRPAPGSNSR